jgi:peptidoglycan LD-endopeptidase LytH
MPLYHYNVSRIVPFDSRLDHLVALDLTKQNNELTHQVVNNTQEFGKYITGKIRNAGARYAIGGYNEHRTIYSRSSVFDAISDKEEPRRLHLGTDIWGEAGTPVFSLLDGIIHSFAFNDQFGDYGATIITQHNLPGLKTTEAGVAETNGKSAVVNQQLSLPGKFYILYGHLSVRDIAHLQVGEQIVKGQEIAHFGEPGENGHWPPHLHVQIINNIGTYAGDYPGVCRFSEKEKWLLNSPDPEILLQMRQFIVAPGNL